MAWGTGLIYCVGGVNGLYQIIGEILQPVRNKLVQLFHLNRNSLGHKLAHMIGTFILVDFSWIFFRASGVNEAFAIIKSIATIKNPWILFDGSLYTCGLDSKNYWLMLLCITILLAADWCKHKGIVIRDIVVKQDYWARMAFYIIAVMFIAVFGIYGPSYDAANFIYFQF